MLRMKVCTRCGIEKSLENFPKAKKYRNGYRSWCKDCVREWNKVYKKEYRKNNKEDKKKVRERIYKWKKNNPDKVSVINKFRRIRKKYGITKKEYYDIIKLQEGLCPICGLSLDNGIRIDVDHDHKVGSGKREAVRGILHWDCNGLLSRANDDVNRLRNAIEYLLLKPINWNEINS